MFAESRFKESSSFSVQSFTNAPAHFHFANMHDLCHHGESGSGAFFGAGAQEDFFHTNANPEASKKERRVCGKKEITNTGSKSKESLNTSRGRIAFSIANLFTEKEAHTFNGRGIALAQFEKEKNFAVADAEHVITPKEENFAVAPAFRNADRITSRIGNAVADSIPDA
jgi:hypothetical protein